MFNLVLNALSLRLLDKVTSMFQHKNLLLLLCCVRICVYNTFLKAYSHQKSQIDLKVCISGRCRHGNAFSHWKASEGCTWTLKDHYFSTLHWFSKSNLELEIRNCSLVLELIYSIRCCKIKLTSQLKAMFSNQISFSPVHWNLFKHYNLQV